jgi:outer membrane protein OmpA-like peptidoglycan-associated protein
MWTVNKSLLFCFRNFVLASFLFSDSGFAQESFPNSVQEKTVSKYDTVTQSEDMMQPSGLGWTLYLGADGGYVQVAAKDTNEESHKKGYHLGIQGTSFLFINQIGLDIGVGFYRNSVSGNTPEKYKNLDGIEEDIENAQITTQALQLQFAGKYLFSNGWGLGPIGTVLFGEDTGFTPGKSSVPETVFAGLTVHKDFESNPKSNLRMRVGAKVLASLNLTQRTAYLALLSFDIGLPLIRPKTYIVERETLEMKQRTQKKVVERTIEKTVVKERNRFLFDSQTINFETDKSTLSPSSIVFLQKLSKLLQEDANLWNSLLVEGHTDKRGSREHNQTLSEERAQAVKRILISSGISEKRVYAQGFGFDVPFDPGSDALSLARNRRVEMNFSGVTNPQKLRRIVEASK